MFKRSRTAEVTPKSPAFVVRFLGRAETPIVRGPGCTQELMKVMWDKASSGGGGGGERRLPQLRLTIHRQYLDLEWLRAKEESKPERIPMKSVTYCSIDRSVNRRIFSWIHADSDTGGAPDRFDDAPGATPPLRKHWCVAVVASSSDKARAMSVVLQRAFLTFYKDSLAAARLSGKGPLEATAVALASTRDAGEWGGSLNRGDWFDGGRQPRNASERLSSSASVAAEPDAAEPDAAAVHVEEPEAESSGLYEDVEIAYEATATLPLSFYGTDASYGSLPSAPPDPDETAAAAADEMYFVVEPPSRELPAGGDVDVPCTSL